jgi:indole-3-glycerol phosphate synthase
MNCLTEILNTKRDEVAKLKNRFSINSFKDMEFFHTQSLNFYDKVKNSKDISIIAEIKKASPSKGIIRKNFNHIDIANSYFALPVNGISILTDKNYFQGDINYLNEIARIKQTALLRKDFIIDSIQVYESKANGADLILLICEALSKEEIKDLTGIAIGLGLEVLLELHSLNQLEKIDFELNKIIGANNRNLESFKVDLSVTQNISSYLPENILLVSESGLSRKEDIDYIRNAGADTILVGEHLMRSDNIENKLAELKSWCTEKPGHLNDFKL